ncbi:MAG: hypothetical protein K6F69_06655 [Treponema sp.]|nr:hypothetical protein [Treponema sp.]
MKNSKADIKFLIAFSIATVLITLISILVIFEILIRALPENLRTGSVSLALIIGLVLGSFITKNTARILIKKFQLDEKLNPNIIRLFEKEREE